MTTDTMREAVARAIGVALGDDPEREGGEPITPYLDAADAAIRTVLERLREPSGDVIDAGRDVGPDAPYGVSETREKWITMLDAAVREVG